MDPDPGASDNPDPRYQFSRGPLILPHTSHSQQALPPDLYFPSPQSFPNNHVENGFNPSGIVKPGSQQHVYPPSRSIYLNNQQYPDSQQHLPVPVTGEKRLYRYDKVPNDGYQYRLNGSLDGANLYLPSAPDMFRNDQLRQPSNNFPHPLAEVPTPSSNGIYDLEKFINDPRTNHNNIPILGTNATEVPFSNSYAENNRVLNLSKPQANIEQPIPFIQAPLDSLGNGQAGQLNHSPNPHTQLASVIMHTDTISRHGSAHGSVQEVEQEMNPENDDNDLACAFQILSGPSKGRRQSRLYNGDERAEYKHMNESEIDLPHGQFQQQFNSILNDIGSNESFAYTENFAGSATNASTYWNDGIDGTENQMMPSQNSESFVTVGPPYLNPADAGAPYTTVSNFSPVVTENSHNFIPIENHYNSVEEKYIPQEMSATSYHSNEQNVQLVAGSKPRGSSRPRSGPGRGRGRKQVFETTVLDSEVNYAGLQHLTQTGHTAGLNVTPKRPSGRGRSKPRPMVASAGGADSEAVEPPGFTLLNESGQLCLVDLQGSVPSLPPGPKPVKPKRTYTKRTPKKDNIGADDFPVEGEVNSLKPKQRRTPKAKQSKKGTVHSETSQMNRTNNSSVQSAGGRTSPDITDGVSFSGAPTSRGRGRGRGRGGSRKRMTQIQEQNVPREVFTSFESIAAAVSSGNMERMQTGFCNKKMSSDQSLNPRPLEPEVYPAQPLERTQVMPGIEMVSNMPSEPDAPLQFNTPMVPSCAIQSDVFRDQSIENLDSGGIVQFDGTPGGPSYPPNFYNPGDGNICQNEQAGSFSTSTSVAGFQESRAPVTRQEDSSSSYKESCDLKVTLNKLSFPHHKSRGKRSRIGRSRRSTVSDSNGDDDEATEDDNVEPKRKTRSRTGIRKSAVQLTTKQLVENTEENENLNEANESRDVKYDPEFIADEERDSQQHNVNPIDQDRQSESDQKVVINIKVEEQNEDNDRNRMDDDNNEKISAKNQRSDSTSGRPNAKKRKLLKRPVNRNLKKPTIPMRESFQSNIKYERKVGKRGKGKKTLEREGDVIIKTEALINETTQSHGVVATMVSPSKFTVPLYSDEEKKVLYANERFVININDIDKDPDQIFIWEILEAQQCLRQYYPSKYCEMQFFVSSPVKYYFFEEEFKSDLFYTQYQPIVVVVANEVQTCKPDKKMPFLAVKDKTVQYLHVDKHFFCRMAKCIGKIVKTEHLREDFMKSLQVLTMLTLRPTFLKTFPSETNGHRHATMIQSWRNVERFLHDRIMEVTTSKRFTPDTLGWLLQFPSLHYTTSGVDKNVFCSACDSKNRVPSNKVSFNSKHNMEKPYRLDTFEELEEGAVALPDKDIFWCRACSATARKVHGLIHFRYKLLRITKQNIIKDLEIFNRSNAGANENAVLWAQEIAINWKNKMFLDFQMTVAEVEQEFSSLKEETEPSSSQ